MGSLWDADYEIGPMKTDPGHTQPLDTQILTPPLSDEKAKGGDADECMQDTEPFDDTVPVEDAFDTQVVCLAGETQVMDLGGETQLLDDFDCIGDMETQLLDLDDRVVSDSEGEDSDATQVLDVDDDASEEVSVTRGDGQLADEEKAHCAGICQDSEKRLMQQASHLVNEQRNAGYMRMHFTSVRAASLRASGLAARNNSGSRSVPCGNHSLEQLATIGGTEVDQENDMGRNDDTIKSSRVGSSTVRKLFTDDPDGENEGFPHDSNSFEEGEDLLQLPSCDLAGLSYADSQEPGELSQANALNFVDKFLQDNAEEFDKEGDRRKSSKKNSKVVSSAKGPQTLAKKVNDISLVTDAGIYEWDDNREDEGGGELFRRKRTDFFSGGSHGSKSVPQPRKAKRNRTDELNDNKRKLQGKNKKIGVVHSDSKLLVRDSKAHEKMEREDEMRHKRNLTSEFDEQFNICSTRGQLDVHDKTQVPEMLNVGFDTQIAAEAMEALFNGEGISNCEANDAIHRNSPEGSMGEKTKNISVKKPPSRKRARLSDAGVDSRESQQAKKTRRVDPYSSKDSLTAPPENSKNARKPHETALVITKSKKPKSHAAKHDSISQRRILERVPSVSIDQRTERSKKQNLQHGGTSTPIARRTRQSMLVNQFNIADNASTDCGEESSHVTEDAAGVHMDEELSAKSSKQGPNEASRVGKTKQNQYEHADVNFRADGNGVKLDGLSFPRRRRSQRNLSGKVYGPDDLDDPSEPSIQPEKFGKCGTRHKRPQDARGTTIDKTFKRETRSSTCGSLGNKNLEGNFAQKNLDKGGSGGAPLHCNSSHKTVEKTVRAPDRLSDASASSVRMRDKSPRQKAVCQQSDAACTTPVNHNKVAVNDVSPVCMGNEYFKQSCKRSLSRPSLLKELRDLSPLEPEPISTSKDLRRRRDMTDVRVLYSHHLDEDIIKQQKKVLGRLGVSVASSMTDATHFIADHFVRTRNMLEAIASGKPVVTHLWLESCGQANCFIDEKNYILRDTKKEKQFGFSMPASLACACQHPLLKDRKVFITPNTKPGKEIISSLVKAVNGQAVERIGRSALKADQIPDDLLVLSCEEDYEICVPLLEKGAAVYSSELVLNGIVTQKLEFERHRIFTDQVKKTRSTIWLRKDGNKFQPVSKNK
ncbi:uncharacterized protein LOC133709607 [Rosa rugosa]|uniref:uncharacterized protein LOC133709607 n=1 Tax=Rosa rugosa TaxID=74645 RepID=UPI002B41529F|nr:uncharacterized protein LOC133709607 [Rosa rugosa]